MRRSMLIGLLIAAMSMGWMAVRADDQSYSGRLDNSQPTFSVTFDLAEGDSVYISADATSGDLDTYLVLHDPVGIVVAENDDRDFDQLNSALGHSARTDGMYTVILSRFEEDMSGGYHLSILVGDASVLENLDTQSTEFTLSGSQLLLDTAHFRIHYTLEGTDAVTEAFVRHVGKAMEEVWRKQVMELGWPAPPSDGRDGGDARMDVYLMDLLDDDGNGIMGAARAGHQFGDNPSTAAVEAYASSTLLRMDNDFEELAYQGDPLDLMHSTAAHEFHHAIQHGYDIDDLTWYAEASAVWMEAQTFPKTRDAAGYAEYAYRYPELCFGSTNDPDGGMVVYGEWMFIQSLVDRYGQKALFKLWNNIAQYDGWEALAQTLVFFDDSIPNALARYHIQNIARDYTFAPDFGGSSVWLSDTLSRAGRIQGYGVQELGANYIAFDPPQGTYRVDLVDDGTLELWAVGVADGEAVAFPLGRGGVVSSAGYDYLYLMVFNPAYQDDLDNCVYTNYALDVTPTRAAVASSAAHTWDAKYFVPLTGE